MPVHASGSAGRDAVHRGGDGVLPLRRVDAFVEVERDGRLHSLLQGAARSTAFRAEGEKSVATRMLLNDMPAPNATGGRAGRDHSCGRPLQPAAWEPMARD